MEKKIKEVIDADLYSSIPRNSEKSARIVSVLQQNKLNGYIDCDTLQMQSEIQLGRMFA